MELEHIAAFDRQTVVAVISAIVETDAERGYIDHYRFGVFPRADGGSMVIVMDCFLQLQASYNMLRIMAAMFLICLYSPGPALQTGDPPLCGKSGTPAAVCHRCLPRAENAAGYLIGGYGSAGGLLRREQMAGERPESDQPAG